jgi:hypothetical protein
MIHLKHEAKRKFNTFKIQMAKTFLGRFRRRQENNIKIELKEIAWQTVNLIRLVEDRDQWRDHVNTVMNLRIS